MNESCPFVRAPEFAIRPHPEAPHLSNKEEGKKYIKEVMKTFHRYKGETSGEFIQILRELGLVSLWFFLKFIAGFSGPYELLNLGLHLDMCNFRQSDYCMGEGARWAMFLPRGFRKSTIGTHGANTWCLTRDPNLKIRLVNATISRATGFMHRSKNVIESNHLYRILYPDRVPEPGQKRWNDREIVMPNRTRDAAEPSIQPAGAEAASEGPHHTDLDIDDLLGLDELDKEMNISANMYNKDKWFRTNSRALLDDWITSRIGVKATLYSAEDVYHKRILNNNMFRLVGYEDSHLKQMVNPHLSENEERYTVYAREILEHGEPIFKEGGFTKEKFEVLLKDDPWTAMSQYANNPQQSGLAEFLPYETKRARVFYSRKAGDFIVLKEGIKNIEDEHKALRLSKMDVVMSVDLAATDKGITAKTSRSSIGIWAMDNLQNVYRIWSRVGYFRMDDLFDNIFAGHEAFLGYIRATVVESNAMQKGIEQLLEREQFRRGVYVNPVASPAKGDKIARIRSVVGLFLASEKVYLAYGCGEEFLEEKNVFPMMENRMDVLDESEKGISELYQPPTGGEVEEMEEEEEEYRIQTMENAVGY